MSYLTCSGLGGISSISTVTLDDTNTSPLFSQRRKFTKSLKPKYCTRRCKDTRICLCVGRVLRDNWDSGPFGNDNNLDYLCIYSKGKPLDVPKTNQTRLHKTLLRARSFGTIPE